MPQEVKKICYLTDTQNPHSGWGRLSREVIKRVINGAFESAVLAREGSGCENERAILQSGFLGIFLSVFRIRPFLKRCDIVHAFDGWPNAAVAAFANIFLKKRFFITAVGTYSVLPLDRFWQGLLLRFAYRRAEKILAISNYTKDEISKRVSLENIEVVNLGVDFEKFHRACARPGGKKNILLSVGEIKQRKGYHVALEAFFMLKKKFPDLKYIIAGCGNDLESNYYRYLLEIIQKNGGEGDVVFTGDVSEEKLLELYGRAKIFILPSIKTDGAFEGFGLVLLEANAAGIPAIGTKPSGMEDIISEGINGYLVSQNDSKSMANCLNNLLSDQELYVKLSNGALKTAQEMSWDKTINRYLSLYEQNLTQH